MTRLQQTVLLVSIAFVSACGKFSSTAEHNCPGANPGIVPININYKDADIKVTPDQQTAHQGDELRFNLDGENKVEVSTSGKTADAVWLNGKGSRSFWSKASKHFSICVPTDLFPAEANIGAEKEFGYNVNAVGKPQLDPTVRIIKN